MLWYWDHDTPTNGPTTVDEVIIEGTRDPQAYNEDPFWPDPGNILPWGELFVNVSLVATLEDSGNPVDTLWNWLANWFNDIHEDTFGHPPAWELSARDQASTFSPAGKIREHPESNKWYDPSTDSFWMDLNGNGTPETNFIFDGSDTWVDTNFDGNFEHKVDKPDY